MSDEFISHDGIIARLEHSPLMEHMPSWVRDGIIDLIQSHPAADVVEATRKWWIVHNDGTAECPECHTLGSPQWKCCPVCAVMMEGKETDNA